MVGAVLSGIAGCSWSPDLTLLVVVTAADTVILMSREFDEICEFDLHPNTFGQDQLVTVGWGKKETQFQGAAGKQAAFLKPEERTPVFAWDDRRCRISWRGDAQFFAISSIEPETQQRLTRVWSRDGVHCSTLRAIAGIEHALTWRPSGNWLQISAHRDGELELVAFERNGEIRHRVSLRRPAKSATVFELVWNNDSSVLAIWLHDLNTKEHFVELWTCSNYHWYRKKTFYVEEALCAMVWDVEQENVLHLCTTTGQYSQIHVRMLTQCSTSVRTDCSATVAVVDGEELNLTSFAQCVVPPPMAQHTVKCQKQVQNVVFGEGGKIMVITGDGKNECAVILTGIEQFDGRNDLTVVDLPRDCAFSCHFAWLGVVLVCASSCFGGMRLLFVTCTHTEKFELREQMKVTFPVASMLAMSDGRQVLLQTNEGSWFTVNVDDAKEPMPFLIESNVPVKFPKRCFENGILSYNGKDVLIGLASTHQLYVNNQQIAADVNSFGLHSEWLLFTTLHHRLFCVPNHALSATSKLPVVSQMKELLLLFYRGQNLDTQSEVDEFPCRSIERGSWIVAVVADGTRVVLQMARGNLETIEPRALLIALIAKHIQRLAYFDAFAIMKRHRINLNFLFDFNPEAFLTNVRLFIEQMKDETNLNLFLMELSNENTVTTMYADIMRQLKPSTIGSDITRNEDNDPLDEHECNKQTRVLTVVRNCLEQHFADRTCFVTSTLITLLRAQPPRVDEALRTVAALLMIAGRDCPSVLDALRHVRYSIDDERLFNLALGTYDFELVLLVAETSNKDPKEYVPFLNELRRLPPEYMRFRIDCHLEKPRDALRHAVTMDEEYWPECVSLIEKHELHACALTLFDRADPRYAELCRLYGHSLSTKRQYADAAVVFERAGDFDDSLGAYEHANDYVNFVRLARQQNGIPDSQVKITHGDSLKKMAKRLALNNRHCDAAKLYEYLDDLENAMKCCCDGNEWSRAVYLAAIGGEKSQSSAWSCVCDRLVVRAEAVCARLDHLQQQMKQHADRLEQVRREKLEKLKRWIEQGEPDWLAEAELYSEASTVSNVSSASASSMKSVQKRQRRRETARRKASTKRGSKWEDLALMQTLHDGVRQIDAVQDDLCQIIPALLLVHEQPVDQLAFDLHGRMHAALRQTIVISGRVWPTTGWRPNMLPGPLEELYMDENEQIQLPVDQLAMPPPIAIDASMIRPVVREQHMSWCVRPLHDR